MAFTRRTCAELGIVSVHVLQSDLFHFDGSASAGYRLRRTGHLGGQVTIVLQLKIETLEELCALLTLSFLVSVEQPGHNLLVLKLVVIHMILVFDCFEHFAYLLMNLVHDGVERVLVGVHWHVVLLERHGALIQVHLQRYTEEQQGVARHN